MGGVVAELGGLRPAGAQYSPVDEPIATPDRLDGVPTMGSEHLMPSYRALTPSSPDPVIILPGGMA